MPQTAFASKCFSENAQQRRPIDLPERRNPSDHLHFAILLDRLAILAVLLADHDHASHVEPGGSQRRERQQRVIDRSQRCARRRATPATPVASSGPSSTASPLIGTSTPPAPSTIRLSRFVSRGIEFFAGRCERPRAARPDAAKPAAQSGTPPRTSRSRGIPARRITVLRSVPSRVPV